jgi:hypothetical protein
MAEPVDPFARLLEALRASERLEPDEVTKGAPPVNGNRAQACHCLDSDDANGLPDLDYTLTCWRCGSVVES